MKINRVQINDTTYNFEHTIDTLEERVFEEKHYLLPIPQFERDKNPNLEQNFGYN